MNRAAAKVSIVAILALTLGCGAAAIAGCSKSTNTTYSLTYTEKEEYFDAELPVRPLTEEQYDELGIRKVILDLTIHESGTYTLVAKDMGITDSENAKAWHRTYTVEGTYTTEDMYVYSLSEAASVKCRVRAGKYFEESYGKSGTIYSKDDPALLAVFTACSAQTDGTAVTYILPGTDTDPAPAAPDAGVRDNDPAPEKEEEEQAESLASEE